MQQNSQVQQVPACRRVCIQWSHRSFGVSVVMVDKLLTSVGQLWSLGILDIVVQRNRFQIPKLGRASLWVQVWVLFIAEMFVCVVIRKKAHEWWNHSLFIRMSLPLVFVDFAECHVDRVWVFSSKVCLIDVHQLRMHHQELLLVVVAVCINFEIVLLQTCLDDKAPVFKSHFWLSDFDASTFE